MPHNTFYSQVLHFIRVYPLSSEWWKADHVKIPKKKLPNFKAAVSKLSRFEKKKEQFAQLCQKAKEKRLYEEDKLRNERAQHLQLYKDDWDALHVSLYRAHE